jgi:predicted dehydrogenase
VLNVALIGYGYWGPNLFRNFNNNDQCRVKYVFDSRPERLAGLAKQYPSVKIDATYDAILADGELDAILIATPVHTHHPLAKKALTAGKHVLVEKPLALSSEEGLELRDLAARSKKVLMVDHTFLYTGAVQKMKELVDNGSIGKITYFDSTRINLGLFQPDINVLWDLAPHDISILNYLVAEQPYSVNATGISHTHNGIENIAYLTVNYNSDFIAHFACSWSSPVKIRTTLIGGDKKMLLFNDLEPTEKIRIYDTGYSHKTEEEQRRVLVDYRVGDVYLPKVGMKEALAELANDFLAAIQQGKKPLSDIDSAIKTLRILDAAQQSIKNRGREVKIES